MKKTAKKKEPTTESVKIRSDKVDIARLVKNEKGIPIGRVFEDAIQYYVDDTKILQKSKSQS